MRIEVSVKQFNGKGRYVKGTCETIGVRGRKLPKTYDIADFIYAELSKQQKSGWPFEGKRSERVIGG